MLEQLAECDNDDGDDVAEDDVQVLGVPARDEVTNELNRMIRDAAANGFDSACMDEMRNLVMRFSGVWSTRISPGEAAGVEPLRVRLDHNAEPYRAAVRRYPEAQRQSLREYVRELEEMGLIYRNNFSR